jgi:sugar transferase (PEP-CTERM/EpsH1 system associated)
MTRDERPLVVHVIHHFVVGGMENGIVSLINHMPPTLFRHLIVCIEDFSDFRHRLDGSDTEVIALHRSRIGAWRMRYRLFKLFRRLRPALVHSRNQSGLDALLPARLAGVPHCLHGEHGWDVHDLHGRSLKEIVLRRLHAPLVGGYITVSRSLQRYLVRQVGIRPGRIQTICNGVDTTAFQPREPRPSHLLPEGFAAEGAVVIGTVGRLQPVKDQATLLRAFACLVNERGEGDVDARLVVVGDGPLCDALPALARELGIADKTWFAGDRGDIAQVLRVMDVFVLPSLAEGISNTLLEAMATALPLLATRVGGNVELVKEAVNGSLFEAGDVSTLACLLASYVADPGMRRGQGDRSRVIAEEQFSLRRMVESYQSTYERLVFGSEAIGESKLPAQWAEIE